MSRRYGERQPLRLPASQHPIPRPLLHWPDERHRYKAREPQLGWLSAHVRTAAVGAGCVAGIQLGVQRSDVREVPEVGFRKGVCEAAFRLGGVTGARGVRPVGDAPRPSGTNPVGTAPHYSDCDDGDDDESESLWIRAVCSGEQY